MSHVMFSTGHDCDIQSCLLLISRGLVAVDPKNSSHKRCRNNWQDLLLGLRKRCGELLSHLYIITNSLKYLSLIELMNYLLMHYHLTIYRFRNRQENWTFVFRYPPDKQPVPKFRVTQFENDVITQSYAYVIFRLTKVNMNSHLLGDNQVNVHC